MTLTSPREKAEKFLETAHEFHLGRLPTESRHPRTTNLSQMAISNLSEAIELLRDVELQALRSAVLPRLECIRQLSAEIRSTLQSGGRIFLCGCGATGRLSLAIETIWREERSQHASASLREHVLSFMAGGDYALVRSIENFEDHPEFGARQLRDAGFSENDLLLAITEGGETPFVIGAAEEATSISKRAPFFLYCNSDAILKSTVERSRRVLMNPKIRNISFETGPMALTGSTRLQASTALMLVAGAALFSAADGSTDVEERIRRFIAELEKCPLSSLEPLIKEEARCYETDHTCVHRTSAYGIAVLTDTTERSPTFSLIPFENTHEPSAPLSWTYLVVPDASDAPDSWRKILRRPPRALEWDSLQGKYGERILYGFDFSSASLDRRKQRSQREPMILEIDRSAQGIRFRMNDVSVDLPRPARRLDEHLLLKCALNICSTLVMGRLRRFEGNLMLFVRSSNNKLIDRSIRFVGLLLEEAGIQSFSYEDICHALFETLEDLEPGEAAVPKVYERLRSLTLSKVKSGETAKGRGER